jgi:predicted nucleotidyltransferase
MGIRKPKVGRHEETVQVEPEPVGLASSLFTKTQQRVFGLVFGQPHRTFHLSELISLAGAGTGAVQREVARLVASGLVSVIVRDGRKVYQANERSPLFAELCSIVAKTSGIAELLRRALESFGPDIVLAILFGSVAKETDRADSDVDLLIVSDTLLLEDIYRTLGPVEERLRRTINPTCYTKAEFDNRRRNNNPFLTKVLAGKYQVLVGELNGDQGA